MPTNDHYIPNDELLKLIEGKPFRIREDGAQVYDIALPRTTTKCPHCHTLTNTIKDYRWQNISLGLGILGIPAFLHVHRRRYRCTHCGCTFMEKIPGCQRYQHMSQLTKQMIIHEVCMGNTFTEVARRFHVSTTTVIRIFDQISFPPPAHLPRVLSIDEFKGNAGKQRYQVALVDPVMGVPLDILSNRDTNELIEYFMQFPRQERRHVKYVCMDLSPIFRRAIRTVFQNAKIVADRFHVKRQVIRAMENVRIRVQKEYLKRHIPLKRNKSLMNKNRHRLSEYEMQKLANLLYKAPELRKAYMLKEMFTSLLQSYYEARMRNKAKNFKHLRKEIRKAFHNWLEAVREAKLPEFRSILISFQHWEKEIVESIMQPYSNGYVEGHNNRIKVFKRTCYGVRNFRRFRNKILFTAAFCHNPKNQNKCSFLC